MSLQSMGRATVWILGWGASALLLAGCASEPAEEATSEPEERAIERVADEPPADEPPPVDAVYREEVESWHSERIDRLRQPGGWLTLVGLEWLEEGDNAFGSAEDNDLVFPEPAPARAGVLRLADGEVTLIPAEGVTITHDEEPVEGELMLVTDADPEAEATVLALGSLRFHVIDREGELGVRIRDHASPKLAEFEGIERFPIDPRLRFEARFEPYEPPKPVKIPNVLGGEFEETSPGVVVFEHQGRTLRLDATGDPAEELFLVFGDATNRHETYGGGRFVTTGPVEDGRVVVDFNLAYNPPCVFTPYATCPLPPPQNKLDVALRAGEKSYAH